MCTGEATPSMAVPCQSPTFTTHFRGCFALDVLGKVRLTLGLETLSLLFEAEEEIVLPLGLCVR